MPNRAGQQKGVLTFGGKTKLSRKDGPCSPGICRNDTCSRHHRLLLAASLLIFYSWFVSKSSLQLSPLSGHLRNSGANKELHEEISSLLPNKGAEPQLPDDSAYDNNVKKDLKKETITPSQILEETAVFGEDKHDKETEDNSPKSSFSISEDFSSLEADQDLTKPPEGAPLLNQTFVNYLETLDPMPKKVHMFFPDKNYWRVEHPLPFVQNSILSLMRLNPEWNVTVYDDNDIDDILRKAGQTNLIPKEECDMLVGEKDGDGNVLKESAHIVEKSDIARLILMYTEGGFYIDADRLVSKEMSDVIRPNTRMCLPTSNDVNFAQDLMCTSPGNKIFQSMIREASNHRLKGGSDGGPLERRGGWISGGSLFGLGPPLYNKEILKGLFVGMKDDDYDENRISFALLRKTLLGTDGLIMTGKEISCNEGILVDKSAKCFARHTLYNEYGLAGWAEQVNGRWEKKEKS